MLSCFFVLKGKLSTETELRQDENETLRYETEALPPTNRWSSEGRVKLVSTMPNRRQTEFHQTCLND